MNERDAAQYFFLFCGCLGIPSLTSSNARVGFVQKKDHFSYLLFDFTYGRSADDALRACESRSCPRTEMPEETRLLFGVNYNPKKRNIDKPLTASFRSECTRYVPNFAASDSFCSEFAWSLTSRDECGRGCGAMPMGVAGVLAWLRKRRERKERERNKRERKERERIERAERKRQLEADRLEMCRRRYVELYREREQAHSRDCNDPPMPVKIILSATLFFLMFALTKACSR